MTFPRLAASVLALSVGISAVAAPAAAGDRSALAVLDAPGTPQLIIAGDSRVVASYAEEGGALRLTLRLSARALGADAVSTQVRLVDGQQHRIILRGRDSEVEGDRFTFTRQGGLINVVAFDGDAERQIARLDD